jgi:CP family cyanate transporter-like MFS transporter
VSSTSPRQTFTTIALLWLSGAGLRLTVLAIPPVIALIQADLGLSGTEVGILSGLPVILFAVAALPGSLLIARVGAMRTLVIGLLLAGVASGLRGVVPNVTVLYLGTILMAAGVAVMQPSLPALVRQWLPEKIGFGSAVYTNGLLVGETLPVALTVPLIFPLVDGSWRVSLAIWGLPLFLIAVGVLAAAPRPTGPAQTTTPRWWPDWKSGLIWRLGLVFSSTNSVYFGTNAFLPGYLTSAGHPELISIALTALNFMQLPSSFLLLFIAGRLERQVWPFVVNGLIMLGALAGIVSTASVWTVVFAGLLGFVGAATLGLGLALPVLLSAPEDIARTSAAMFTISYACAMLWSVVSGAAWDLAGDPRLAFLPLALSLLPVIVLTPTMPLRRTAV